MKTVNVHEAKTHLSALLLAVEKGERVRICRNGKLVAWLTQPEKPKRSRLTPHPVLSKGKIIGDVMESEWPVEYT
jgi:prevent-host-death family protein